MARRFIVRNRRKRKILFSILFVMLFVITIGYSNLSTILNIGGNLEIAKAKCPTYNKLYNVLKCGVEEGLAREYTSTHNDSMDSTLSTEKIYYWYAPDTTAGNTLADQILEKNNVIFAGQCWQMIRTTDTGGVKLVYNGKEVDGKCLPNRLPQVGYGARTSINLAANYYYGTDYTYDSVNNVFSISGTTEQATWNATTGPDLIGKYTCRETNIDASCSILYLVESYNDASSGYALPLLLDSPYYQFGSVPFNSANNSPAYVGYMYGDVYPALAIEKEYEISFSSYYTQFMSRSFVESYLYSKTINYSNNTYYLVNPILGSNVPEDSYSDYYSFGSSSTTSGYYPYYIIGKNGTGNNYYVTTISGGKTLNDLYLLMGDTLTDNQNGTYTISNTVSISPIEWYSNYSNYNNKYTCGDATTTTCSNPRFVYSTQISGYYYLKADEKMTIGKTRNGLALTDTITVRKDEWYNNYGTYSDYKYTCGNTNTTCTEDNLRLITNYNSTGYKYSSNHYWGSSVTWDGTKYTLVDPIDLESISNLESLDEHHYICVSAGLKSCEKVAYVYYIDDVYYSEIYYILLENGVESIEEVLDSMLANNVNNSIVKTAVEAWYKHTILPFDNKVEDVIYCNSRGKLSYDGWSPNGGSITNTTLSFLESLYAVDLGCSRPTDSFSISNNSAKLAYKVGLLTNHEVKLLVNKNIRKTGHDYWLMTPNNFYKDDAYIFLLRNDGENNSAFYPSRSLGLRPAISLSAGIEYGVGDGSTERPYYVGDVYNITNNSSTFHVKEKSPPGWTVKLESNDYVATSFRLNGTLVEGDSFIMPEENVTITDIQYVIANYSITNTDSSVTVPSVGRYRSTITLEAEGYKVSSFKLNGSLVMGNSFVMPAQDVVITDISKTAQDIVESDHNPYANNINNVTYYEKTFDGATSITVEFTYQTESTSYDYIYLYDTSGSTTPFNNKKYGGSTLKTETLTINSNYLKIVFRTDGVGNNFYGFKAVITPNY